MYVMSAAHAWLGRMDRQSSKQIRVLGVFLPRTARPPFQTHQAHPTLHVLAVECSLNARRWYSVRGESVPLDSHEDVTRGLGGVLARGCCRQEVVQPCGAPVLLQRDSTGLLRRINPPLDANEPVLRALCDTWTPSSPKPTISLRPSPSTSARKRGWRPARQPPAVSLEP